MRFTLPTLLFAIAIATLVLFAVKGLGQTVGLSETALFPAGTLLGVIISTSVVIAINKLIFRFKKKRTDSMSAKANAKQPPKQY